MAQIKINVLIVVALSLCVLGARSADLTRLSSLKNFDGIDVPKVWRHLYLSVFRSSLTKPIKSAETGRPASELLQDMRALLSSKDKAISAEERHEVQFWLELSIKDKYDAYVYCKPQFEQKIAKRRLQLIDDPDRLGYYPANTVVPQDLKLDEYIEERRRSIFENCQQSYDGFIAARFKQLSGSDTLRLNKMEEIAAKADSDDSVCDDLCKQDRLAYAVSEEVAPHCKQRPVLDLFCGLGLNRKEFDAVYDEKFKKPCDDIRKIVHEQAHAMNLFLDYVKHFWMHAAKGHVKHWIDFINVCENIEDEKFAERAFHFIPKVRKARKAAEKPLNNFL